MGLRGSEQQGRDRLRHQDSGAPRSGPAGPRDAAGVRCPQVHVRDRAHQTIWVAAAQNPAYPLSTTGWVLKPGQGVTITVPNHWNGRFWGRTGCKFHHGAATADRRLRR